MSFYPAALGGVVEGEETRQAEARGTKATVYRIALQAIMDPDTPEDLRAQYRAILQDSPYADLANVQFPVSAEAQLRQRFGPVLSALQLAGGLGQAGALTPESATEIEAITGQRVFPRRTVPGDVVTPAKPAVTAPVVGEVSRRTGGRRLDVDPRTGKPLTPQLLEPAQPEVRGPEREEIDISRFGPTGQIMVKLSDGREVPLEQLKGFSAEVIMWLVRGQRGQPKTYGEAFGDIVRPELRDRPIVYDEGGKMVIRDDFFTQQATPGQVLDQQKAQRQQMAIAAYQRELQTSGDPQKAWLAASAIDPITFEPKLASASDQISQQKYQQQTRALAAYNQVVGTGGTADDAYKAAFAVWPEFPVPPGVVRPGTQSPQQAVWAKYFRGEPLNPQEQRYIENELTQKATQDPRFLEDMRIISTFIGFKPEDLTPQQREVLNTAVQNVAAYLGVPAEPIEQMRNKGWWRAITDYVIRGKPFRLQEPVDQAQQWAAALYAEMKTKVGTDRKALEREFNRLRKAPNAGNFSQAYWRALYDMIVKGK